MKITYSSRNGTLSAEIQADTQKELFQQIASFQEVFDETLCGACNGADLRFVVRNIDDNDFFELHCLNKDCRHRLAFGQHKKGGSLFPSRKDKDGKWLAKNGWTKWNPDTKKEE